MSETIILRLNDGLYNASLLGFYKVLQLNNVPITIQDDSLCFDSNDLNNFTKYYFNTLIRTFYDETVFSQIEKCHEQLKSHSSMTIDELQKIFDFVSEKTKRNSYKAAIDLIHSRGESYDFTGSIKKIKGSDNMQAQRRLLQELLGKMVEYRDVFILKDITYTKIQPFWTNVAFLNSKNNKMEFEGSFESSFVQPAKEFTNNSGSKAKLQCCQCGQNISRSQAFAMSWINDVGIDLNRKRSYYWNFNADSFLCPICNLVYACMPLGFLSKGTESIFINRNSSIDTLIESNATLKEKLSPENSTLFYQIIEKFISLLHQTTAERELDNIQVIRRSGSHYAVNILSRKQMQAILHCQQNIKYLAGSYERVDGKRIFDLAMDHLLSSSNLFSLIYICLNEGLRKGTRIDYITNLVMIQCIYFNKGADSMNKYAALSAMENGNDLRKVMLGDEKNENKIKSLSYSLLTSLKSRNSNAFADIILRQYISEKISVPQNIINILSDETEFLNYGYAFVTGLNMNEVKKTERGQIK